MNDPEQHSSTVPVIVLNWNGAEDTINCIDHLLASTDVEFRVILIDNASEGEDYAQLVACYGSHPLIDLRRNDQNLGFARGVNRILS